MKKLCCAIIILIFIFVNQSITSSEKNIDNNDNEKLNPEEWDPW